MASNTQVRMLHDRIFEQTKWYGNFRATMPLSDRKIEFVKAAHVEREKPPPNVALGLGPNPKLRPPSQAQKVADEAAKIATQATEHMVDLDRRLRNAANVHADKLSPKLWDVTMGPKDTGPKRGLDMEHMARIKEAFTKSIKEGTHESVTSHVMAASPNSSKAGGDLANAFKVEFDRKMSIVIAVDTANYLKQIEESRAQVLHEVAAQKKDEAAYANETAAKARAECVLEYGPRTEGPLANLTNMTRQDMRIAACVAKGNEGCYHEAAKALERLACGDCWDKIPDCDLPIINSTGCKAAVCNTVATEFERVQRKALKTYTAAQKQADEGVMAATIAAMKQAQASHEADAEGVGR